jgi:hypothetical protein
MKRFRLLTLLYFSVMLLLVACRGAGSPASVPSPTDSPTATPTAPTTASNERGEEPAIGLASPVIIASDATTEEIAGGRGILYSVQFDVQPDGFGFRNYGPGYPEGDFTIAELRELFGDGVCSRIDDDGELCIPTAEAQQWIVDRNADMRAGHCIGFTVASYRFATGDLRPENYNVTADYPFDIAQDAPIMRTIALNGSLYWVKSVWSSEVTGTPREIIDALIALQEPVDLSIFLPGLVGGHSLLAYGVEEVAPNQYRILVYDNNFPGQEPYVEVDYEADTWRYDQGAVNPDQTAIPYEGDAATGTLRFIPLSAYESASCPFCPPDADSGSDEAESDGMTLISVLGKGEVLAKTALGVIGVVAGEIINEIPGARLIFPRGQLAADGAPAIALPDGADFTLEFNNLDRVSGLGSNLSFTLDRLTPAREDNRLTVAPDGQTVEFQAGGDQAPSLSVTIRQADASYKVTLLNVDFEDGEGLSVGAPEKGEGLELRSRDIDVTDATLLLTRLTAEEESIFATSALNVQSGGGINLDIAEWDGSGAIDVFADEDGDGEFDESPTELTNEPLDELLQDSDAGEMEAILDTLTPFLGDSGLEAILEALAEQDLSGQEIGEILRPLQLTDEELIEVIPPLSLPVPEVGELLFALRLEPERVEVVSEGLELDDEDDTVLREYLDNLVLFHEIVTEWAFLQINDLDQLVVLLAGHNLTADQLVLLLPRMGLSVPDIEYVLARLELSSADLIDVVEELGVNMPPTLTPTPTLSLTGTVTITVTTSITLSGSLTPVATPTLSVTTTIAAVATPAETGTPDPYPGVLPPTGTPDPYPYPGAPSPTTTPGAYPGGPTATPDYDSLAFCVGDDLRVVPQESTWVEETIIELWDDGELLFTGEIGPDDEPLVFMILGPDTWEELYIVASTEPIKVPLGEFTCPDQE